MWEEQLSFDKLCASGLPNQGKQLYFKFLLSSVLSNKINKKNQLIDLTNSYSKLCNARLECLENYIFEHSKM